MRNCVGFNSLVLAEFIKLWRLRITIYGVAGTCFLSALVAWELSTGERLAAHVDLNSPLSVMPILFWSTWGKLIFIQLFVMIYSAYAMTVDSQHGMVKINFSCPFSRISLINARMIAMLMHVGLIVFAYVWALYSLALVLCGGRGMCWHDLWVMMRFVGYLIVFLIGFAWTMSAAAMLRNSLLGAFVAVIGTMVLMVAANTLPTNMGLRPYLLIRYWDYALNAFHSQVVISFENLPNMNETLLHFIIAAFFPAMLLHSLAAAFTCYRDVTE